MSPPFSENARLILKVSHNLHASTLPLLIALRHGKRQLEEGLRLEHDFLKRAGLDADSISFAGGAGGAQADQTTPRMTVALLRYMSTRPDFAVYERALPLLGVDGTLADVVPTNSPARGKVRAKTGTLFWQNLLNDHYLVTSKALAGYLTAKSGRELVFSFVVNGVQIDKLPQTKTIGQVLAHLCEIVQQAH
jgi:D-alanyl-D-alanine carboxypeptidase/D-alanyl-D-alanine-endopeptidase (penicillin-binding protein 4)